MQMIWHTTFKTNSLDRDKSDCCPKYKNFPISFALLQDFFGDVNNSLEIYFSCSFQKMPSDPVLRPVLIISTLITSEKTNQFEYVVGRWIIPHSLLTIDEIHLD